jgi:2-keto-3-deoxy-L-rhamnonate aldolase RhmA
MGERIRTFRARLKGGDPLVGTFIKTPSPIICEVLSLARLDVVCLDCEHAPFGRLEVDSCVAVLRAADQPSLVRVAADSAADIRNALDCGATGILVPHVRSADQALTIVRATRHGEGGRGYSGSTRAAGFTTRSMREHLDHSSAHTTVIVQIEDVAALASVTAIAATEGIDCIFAGRADLAVAMNKDPSAPEVIDAVATICAAGRSTGTAVGMFAPVIEEVPRWRAAGASLFLLGSDQSFVLSGARELAASFGGAAARNR